MKTIEQAVLSLADREPCDEWCSVSRVIEGHAVHWMVDERRWTTRLEQATAWPIQAQSAAEQCAHTLQARVIVWSIEEVEQ